MFALHLRAQRVVNPVREFRFEPTRQWAFDFAWPSEKIAVEIEGGVGGKSRHTSKLGFEEDARKYNRAVDLGWKVYRFSTAMVKRGEAIAKIGGLLWFLPR